MKRVILLSLWLGLLGGCASVMNLKQPEAQLAEVYVKDPTLSGMTLVFVLDVSNPNKRDLKLDEVNYKVFISGKPFAQATTAKAIELPAQGNAKVEVPLPLQYGQLLSTVGSFLFNRKVTYRIEGSAKVALFHIPFDKEGVLNLNRD